MLLIPLILIVAIVGFSAIAPLVKNFHFGLSDLVPNLTLPKNEQNKTAAPKTPTQSQQQTQQYAPRAPPSQQTQKSSVSPYAGKIRISSVQATSTQPAKITLTTNFDKETQMNISGWRVKSTWAGEFVIPYGVSKFHIGTSQPTENIVVYKNDAVYLRGEANPFGRGINFRPNACFGYLSQYYQNLPESFSCPQDKPSVAQIKNLTPSCQEFILNKIDYGACKLPNYANDPSVAGNSECVSYITQMNGGFTYEGCFLKHANDANFIFSKWYIYMDTTFGNSLHDSVTLYDQNGLVVDTYTY